MRDKESMLERRREDKKSFDVLEGEKTKEDVEDRDLGIFDEELDIVNPSEWPMDGSNEDNKDFVPPGDSTFPVKDEDL